MEKEDKLGLQGPNIDLAQTTGVVCKHCGGQVFDQALVLREVSPILTGNGMPGLVPVTVFECTNCHMPVEDLLPDELKGMDFSRNSEHVNTSYSKLGS